MLGVRDSAAGLGSQVYDSSPSWPSTLFCTLFFLTQFWLQLKRPFHSIERTIGLGPDAPDGRSTAQKWSGKASSNRPRTPEHLYPRDKMSLICLGCPTYLPIKLSSTENLATFTNFWSRTEIVETRNFFDFATMSTRITAPSCNRGSASDRSNYEWKGVLRSKVRQSEKAPLPKRHIHRVTFSVWTSLGSGWNPRSECLAIPVEDFTSQWDLVCWLRLW